MTPEPSPPSAESAPRARVLTKSSFLRLVYPFGFDPEKVDDLGKAADQATWPGTRGDPLRVWEKVELPREELLRSVADCLHDGEGCAPTARDWELTGEALQSPAGLGGRSRWSVVSPGGELEFSFTSVELTLFRVGVGFLTVTVAPASDTLEAWIDATHYLRFGRGQRRVGLTATRKTGKDTW